MAVVYLTTTGSVVRRKGERLEVWEKKEKLADLRLFDLERLVVVGAVQLTSQALGLLLDQGIDVVFLSGGGRLRGSLVSAESRNVFLRLAQYDRWKDDAFRLAFSREVV
ncbi:MAG TPA: CRISPR-associated endonuclease Cas1, partial [Thermoanaerobaculia bacterium]|nr:CRISPR-associated endonuclease Cas1 [Thermoanaerobaculia bacterium]